MEEWKAIPGYEGLYEASNLGRIKALPNINHKSTIIMKPRYEATKKRVDAKVNLCKNGKKTTFKVARLVALAWCDGFVDGLTVNHIDGNTLNNNAKNLEWLTQGDNVRHIYETGLYKPIGKKCVLVDSKGNKYPFNSYAEASRFLGRGNHYVAYSLYRFANIVRSAYGDVYGIY